MCIWTAGQDIHDLACMSDHARSDLSCQCSPRPPVPPWRQMYKTIEKKHKMSSYRPHGVKCPSAERRGSPLCIEMVTLTPCSQNVHREAQLMVRWQEPDWWLENVTRVSVNIGLSGKRVNVNFEWTLPLTLNLKRLFEIVILKTYSRWSPLSQTLD